MHTPGTNDQIDVSCERTARRAIRTWLKERPDLFDMNGTLHHWDTGANEGRGALSALDPEGLADYCEIAGLNTVTVAKSGDTKTKDVPQRMAKALLRTKGRGFRRVDSVEHWPVVRPDGSLTDTSGYDPHTRSLVALRDEVKPVAEQPTEGDLAAARSFLCEHLWGSFPFVSRRADLAATFAMYATPLLRSYLGPQAMTSIFLLDATTPGSGKSMLGQIGLSALYGGIELDAGQSDRELQKSIIAALAREVDGSVLSLDNWETGKPVGGELLARLATSPTVEGRLIGSGKFISVPNTFLKVISGNSISTRDDLARRVVFVRLAPDVEKPESTEHAFDYEAEVNENAGEIIHALLTLIRGWTAAGAPRRKVKLGNFTRWASALAGLADWAQIPGFMEDHAKTLEAKDDHGADMGRFLAAVAKWCGEGVWLEASAITREPHAQELAPRREGREDSRIEHRGLARRILKPSRGRIYRDPETGEAYTVRSMWDAHDSRFLWQVVSIAAKRARKAMDTVRTKAKAAKDVLRPRTLPRLMTAARVRREADAPARPGVRVETDLFQRAHAALVQINPDTA